MKRVFLVGLVFVASLATTSNAQAVSPSNIITYQGRVLDANSAPVSSSTISMKFFLYTALTGGTCVWSNSSASCDSNTPTSTTARTVTLTSGLFSENLGDTAASPAYAAIADSSFADNASLYLAVEIAGETLSPRKLLTAAPYALNADTLDGVDLTTIQLWETGSSRTFEDDQTVVIGANSAFSYGSGGVGDLRVVDEFEVSGGFIGNNLVVGASISATETISNLGFSLSGNDLFVASDVGIEGNLYIDGEIHAASTLNVTGNTALVGDLAVNGDDLTTDGDLTFDATNGNMIFANGDTLNIGLTTPGAGVAYNVIGDTTTGAGSAMGSDDDLYVEGNLEVDGQIYVASSGGINIPDADVFSIFDGSGNAILAITDLGTTAQLNFGRISTGTGVDFNFLVGGDDVIFQDNDVLNIGGSGSDTAYNVIGDTTTGAGLGMTSDDDLYIEGELEVDGTATVADLSCTDCLDFAEFADTLTLDATTSITHSGATLFGIFNTSTDNTQIDLGSTGDFIVSDNLTPFLTLTDAGAFILTLDSTDNPAFLITNNGSSAVTTNLAGTGDFVIQDNGTNVFTVTDTGSITHSPQGVSMAPSLSGSVYAQGIQAFTDNSTAASGTATAQVFNSFQIHTLAAQNTSVTTTNAATVYIAGSPGVGTNMTITNRLALWVDSGITRLDGDVYLENTEAIRNSTDDMLELIGRNGTADTDVRFNLDNAAGPIISSPSDATIQIDEQLMVDLAASGGNDAVCALPDDAGNVDVDNQTLADCSTSPAADYAERYPTADGIEYGDIVIPGEKIVTTLDGQKIRELVKASSPYSDPVVGIVSDNWGDFTSAGNNIAESDHPMPIALVGRVSVHVTDENGPIQVGDPITTSSTAGYGMKSTEAGMIVGFALGDFVGPGRGEVMAYVHTGWYAGDVLSNDGSATVLTDKAVIAPLQTTSSNKPTADSFGLAFRGSVWNGSEAEAVEMMLSNTVIDSSHYRLSIRNTSLAEVAYITDKGAMHLTSDLIVGGKLYPSDRGAEQTEKYLFYDGSSGLGGDFMRTNAKGWATDSSNFAEMFPSEETLSAGEVVSFAMDGEKVKRSSASRESMLLGVVSTRPGFLAGENSAGAYPIALVGRVPIRVNLEGDAIAVGDPLTSSSIPGVAMKATQAGTILGYALETFDGTEEKMILSYIHVRDWTPEFSKPIADNRASELNSSATNFSSLTLDGNLFLNGHDLIGLNRISGPADVWSIESDGTVKTQGLLKTITRSVEDQLIETTAVTSPQVMISLVGSSKLENGRKEIRFEEIDPTFNNVISLLAPIRVLVTPHGPVSLFVSEQDQNHFVVETFGREPRDVEFDWIVMGYRMGYELEVENSRDVREDEEELSEQRLQQDIEEGKPQISEITETEVFVEPATPESSELPFVDSLKTDDGGAAAEQPSVSSIETLSSTQQEVQISP